MDFKIRTLDLDGARIKLQLWDTAGHERFRAMVANFYRGAKGILVVYDVTNAESFLNLTSWLEEVERHAGPDVAKVKETIVTTCLADNHSDSLLQMIIGNKTDLSGRLVEYDQASIFASEVDNFFVKIK